MERENTNSFGARGSAGSEVDSRAPATRSLDASDLQERTRMLIEWNATGRPFSSHLCIQQLFEMQVERVPNATAVIYEGEKITYEELNRRANCLANYLIAEGLRPDDPAGLFIERSIDMVVAILAIVKAGGAYVPLDPDYPSARVKYMLEDAKPGIVLTHLKLQDRIQSGSHKNVCLDDRSTASRIDECDGSNPKASRTGVSPTSLAYVIYTSGSTGNPKGVMVEHRALVNRIEWMRNQYGCDSSDAILQKTPFSFDVSVWEFFLPLISGARIVVAKPAGHKD